MDQGGIDDGTQVHRRTGRGRIDDGLLSRGYAGEFLHRQVHYPPGRGDHQLPGVPERRGKQVGHGHQDHPQERALIHLHGHVHDQHPRHPGGEQRRPPDHPGFRPYPDHRTGAHLDRPDLRRHPSPAASRTHPVAGAAGEHQGGHGTHQRGQLLHAASLPSRNGRHSDDRGGGRPGRERAARQRGGDHRLHDHRVLHEPGPRKPHGRDRKRDHRGARAGDAGHRIERDVPRTERDREAQDPAHPVLHPGNGEKGPGQRGGRRQGGGIRL